MKTLLPLFLMAGVLWGQPRLIDAHVHYNGDLKFLDRLVEKLEAVKGVAFLLTEPKDLGSAGPFIAKHPDRLIGFGEIRLDDPNAVELVERFHAAGCRGLGEISGPLKDFHDK